MPYLVEGGGGGAHRSTSSTQPQRTPRGGGSCDGRQMGRSGLTTPEKPLEKASQADKWCCRQHMSRSQRVLGLQWFCDENRKMFHINFPFAIFEQTALKAISLTRGFK